MRQAHPQSIGVVRSATRLSQLHPYPAMVADDLAVALADRYISPGATVLDPFCGSGRLLVAGARKPIKCVGGDLNPLACLLTEAKLRKADVAVLKKIAEEIEQVREIRFSTTFSFRGNWKVEWFSPSVVDELAQIVGWINALDLDSGEKLLVAASLSAAVRDASFARKDGWKLHRMRADRRAKLKISAWDCFDRRLRNCIKGMVADPICPTDARVELTDARRLQDTHSSIGDELFDVVITSPPYGDSRTTVQYGAASALSLEFISKIGGLERLFAKGRDIDSLCLGGAFQSSQLAEHLDIRPYWAGSRTSPYARPVASFLTDFARVCEGIASRLKPKGVVVFVLGCRSTGGFRVKLHEFAKDCFASHGLRQIAHDRRRIRDKQLPRIINRFARCGSSEQRARGLTRTMTDEHVVAFERPS